MGLVLGLPRSSKMLNPSRYSNFFFSPQSSLFPGVCSWLPRGSCLMLLWTVENPSLILTNILDSLPPPHTLSLPNPQLRHLLPERHRHLFYKEQKFIWHIILEAGKSKNMVAHLFSMCDGFVPRQYRIPRQHASSKAISVIMSAPFP